MEYKDVKVVMLPTKEKSNLILVCKTLIYCKHPRFSVIPGAFNQHLYMTSDEEIKEGDFYNFNVGYASGIKKADMYDIDNIESEINAKKIIATTDNSLGLPQPSEEFIEQWIEEYNKGNVITDVKVEYKYFGYTGDIASYNIIVNQDNSINIKLLQPKLYTKEEVIELIHSICGEMYKRNTIYSPTSVDKWLKENL